MLSKYTCLTFHGASGGPRTGRETTSLSRCSLVLSFVESQIDLSTTDLADLPQGADRHAFLVAVNGSVDG
jgi:hypothetical protein